MPVFRFLFFFFFLNSRVSQTQKLSSLWLQRDSRTSKISSVKPAVGQNRALYALATAKNSFLFRPSFFIQLPFSFSCLFLILFKDRKVLHEQWIRCFYGNLIKCVFTPNYFLVFLSIYVIVCITPELFNVNFMFFLFSLLCVWFFSN